MEYFIKAINLEKEVPRGLYAKISKSGPIVKQKIEKEQVNVVKLVDTSCIKEGNIGREPNLVSYTVVLWSDIEL